MIRMLLIAFVLVLVAAGLFFLLQPREPDTQQIPAAAQTAVGGGAGEGPGLVVRVDGAVRTEDVQVVGAAQLSHLPLNQLTPSMISHIGGSSAFRTLVLTDGSSIILDDWTLQQLPDDVAFRAGYGRE